MGKVLITGASGLVGTRLTQLLKDAGYKVVHLGRGEQKDSDVPQYKWDVEKGKLDEAAFEGVTTIIHLAGASIADKAWTEERKKEILDSRIKSAGLLHKFLHLLAPRQ
jgi:NAD dependent epimerase/dehydratase family enzyme